MKHIVKHLYLGSDLFAEHSHNCIFHMPELSLNFEIQQQPDSCSRYYLPPLFDFRKPLFSTVILRPLASELRAITAG